MMEFAPAATATAVSVVDVLVQVMSAPGVQLTLGVLLLVATVVASLAVQPLPLWVTVTM